MKNPSERELPSGKGSSGEEGNGKCFEFINFFELNVHIIL